MNAGLMDSYNWRTCRAQIFYGKIIQSASNNRDILKLLKIHFYCNQILNLKTHIKMVSRLLTLFIFLVFGWTTVQAQDDPMAIGGHIGFNIAHLYGDTEDANAGIRAFIGGNFLLPIGDDTPWSVVTELNYIGAGANANFNEFGTSYTTKAVLHYLQIAGLARYRILQADPVGVVAFAGPQFSFGMRTKTKVSGLGGTGSGDGQSFKDANLNAFDLGLLFGGEADWPINETIVVFGNIRYGFGFLNISDVENVTLRNGTFVIAFGARFRIFE